MNDRNFEIINKIFRFAYIHTRFYFQHFVSSLLPLPQWSVHKTKLCKQSFGLGDVSPASRWYTILPSFLNSFTLQRCILQTLMDLQEIFSGKMSSDVWDPDMEETSNQILRCTFWFQFFCLRLRVVPHFSSGIVERVRRECAWKSPHARKYDTRVAFSRVGWFSLALASRKLYYPWGKMGDYS